MLFKPLHKQFKSFVETFLSGFAYTGRELLMKIILIDLSKALDCISHDLLMAKLYVYGLNEETTTFFYSYLKIGEQRRRMDDILSSLQVLISGVPQGSMLCLILFKIILSDLLKVLKNSDIYNFADDNATSVVSKSRDTLLETLKNRSLTAVNRLKNNNMIVNLGKFQLMLPQKMYKEKL